MASARLLANLLIGLIIIQACSAAAIRNKRSGSRSNSRESSEEMSYNSEAPSGSGCPDSGTTEEMSTNTPAYTDPPSTVAPTEEIDSSFSSLSSFQPDR